MLSFALGYWVNEFLDFVEAMGKDKVGLYALKTDSTGQVVLNDKSKENFDNFLLRYTADSLFQLERIKFPLKSLILNDLDGVDSTLILKKDWKIIRLFRQDRLQIYNNYKKELGDTNERMICYEGIDSGINIEYKFQRLSGLWYLIEYNNFSN